MKRCLFIVSASPYGSTRVIEQLESAMVAAVFDAPTAVLFRSDGIWNLLPGQDAEALGVRTVAKVLTALPTYEIETLYVCADALRQRGLTADALVPTVKPIEVEAQAALIAAHDVVITAQG